MKNHLGTFHAIAAKLLRRHAELDAHAEAIGQAIPIGQQLREVRAELRRADTQRRNATIELAKLGRMALRRRADAQQRLEVASTDVEHWQHLERHLAEQWHGLTRDLGPEHTWDRVLDGVEKGLTTWTTA